MERMPPWLKVKLPSAGPFAGTGKILRGFQLNTVCREARCPNMTECWSAGTATIMILGDTCTRACRFCAVGTALQPRSPEPDEPERVAAGISSLGLKYAVITSVTRDDLPDGGASWFAGTVAAIRARGEGTAVELLIPDFQGDWAALDLVADSGPDIIGHNLETVERLTPLVRDPRTSYTRSLEVLEYLGTKGVATKSGLMLGMGETDAEVIEAMGHLRERGVSHLTLGQYLSPGQAWHPVARYVPPETFDSFRQTGLELGFLSVFSGPLVRSSYHAEQVLGSCVHPKQR